MTTPQKTVHDIATGETVTRDMTADELNAYQKMQAEVEATKQAQTVKQAAREALLTKLGITEQEAQLLLGS
jgi:hypothetical protein